MAHVNIGKVHPEAYKAVMALSEQAEKAADDAGLPPLLRELVRIRASQLNGCAFCLRMHTADATKHGETPERLAVVAAWWESQYFSPAEQAALQLTEQITLIGDAGHLRERGIDVEANLTPEQISAVTWLIVVINAWNRVAISSHYPVR